MRISRLPGALAALLLLLLHGLPAPAVQGAPPEVGVLNVPPQFRSIVLGARGGYHFVDVTVTDFNSWHDILRVDVVVLDDYGGVLAHVRFKQYDEVNATFRPTAAFEDLAGGLLRREVSYFWASNLTDTYVERSELNLTFALRPLRGASLDLVAVDLGGRWAEARVDYTLSAVGGPGIEPFLPPPLAALEPSTVASLAAAALVTAILLRRRYRGPRGERP